MRKRTLTVTCRYEPDKLADNHLSDAYELLLKTCCESSNKKKERKVTKIKVN